MQPAALVNMMTQRTTDHIVFISIIALDQEFSKNKAFFRFPDMFPDSPPAIIKYLFKILLGTFKQRDILLHPLPGTVVRNGLLYILILHIVEIINIMFK